MKTTWTKTKRKYFAVVEYPDGTFRVYEDEETTLRQMRHKEDERVTIVSRIQKP